MYQVVYRTHTDNYKSENLFDSFESKTAAENAMEDCYLKHPNARIFVRKKMPNGISVVLSEYNNWGVVKVSEENLVVDTEVFPFSDYYILSVVKDWPDDIHGVDFIEASAPKLLSMLLARMRHCRENLIKNFSTVFAVNEKQAKYVENGHMVSFNIPSYRVMEDCVEKLCNEQYDDIASNKEMVDQLLKATSLSNEKEKEYIFSRLLELYNTL